MVAVPTAQRILAAARKLLAKGGPEAVTMRRVADAVGVTAMAIYRHYPDRDALLAAVADHGFTELAGALDRARPPRSVEARLYQLLDVYVDHALAHPQLFQLMFLARRPGARRYPRDFKAGRSPTANRFVEAIQAGVASGYLRDEDPWEIAFEAGALFEGLIMLYLGGRIEGNAARFRALVRRSFGRYLHGICR